MLSGPKGADGLTDRQRLFASHYAVHGNASRAARQVGAEPKSANLIGYRILHKPAVQAYLKKANADRCARLSITADEVHMMAASIALHDATKISQMRIGPCHNCWPNWADDQAEAEKEARELANLLGDDYDPDPDDAKKPDSPDQDCTTCGGEGRHYVWFADTRYLPPREQQAFQGASITKDGHKVDLADRLKALDMCAKLLGLYKDSGEDKTAAPNIYINGIRFPPPPTGPKP